MLPPSHPGIGSNPTVTLKMDGCILTLILHVPHANSSVAKHEVPVLFFFMDSWMLLFFGNTWSKSHMDHFRGAERIRTIYNTQRCLCAYLLLGIRNI